LNVQLVGAEATDLEFNITEQIWCAERGRLSSSALSPANDVRKAKSVLRGYYQVPVTEKPPQ